MEMTSLSFLYLFLPVSLAVFYLCPKKRRMPALLLFSLLFYLLGDPKSLIPILLSVSADYLLGRLMERVDENNRLRRELMEARQQMEEMQQVLSELKAAQAGEERA